MKWINIKDKEPPKDTLLLFCFSSMCDDGYYWYELGQYSQKYFGGVRVGDYKVLISDGGGWMDDDLTEQAVAWIQFPEFKKQ